MAYNNQVSLGTSASALGVAYLTGPTNSVLAFSDTSKALTNQLVSVSGNTPSAWTAQIDRAYNTVNFAVINQDRSSSIFTAVTASTTQTVTDNGYNTVTGEIRRLSHLGYL
jgi:hypothetical protein